MLHVKIGEPDGIATLNIVTVIRLTLAGISAHTMGEATDRVVFKAPCVNGDDETV